MEGRKFEIIKQLMEELQEEMQYGEDDLSERLGRKKPGIEVMKIEGEVGDGEMPEELGLESGDGEEEVFEEGPEERLKSRLMKLRGA